MTFRGTSCVTSPPRSTSLHSIELTEARCCSAGSVPSLFHKHTRYRSELAGLEVTGLWIQTKIKWQFNVKKYQKIKLQKRNWYSIKICYLYQNICTRCKSSQHWTEWRHQRVWQQNGRLFSQASMQQDIDIGTAVLTVFLVCFLVLVQRNPEISMKN